MNPTPISLAALAAALLAAGCAAFVNPGTFAPGTSADEARAQLGVPTGEYPLPEGGQRLEYARGPLGKQTWMLDFDASQRLLKAEQVLTEKRFNAIRIGMSRDELLTTLGRPSDRGVVGLQHQLVWSYRYDTYFCQWFRVGIGPDGRVQDTGYYPDPFCDDDDNVVGFFRHRR